MFLKREESHKLFNPKRGLVGFCGAVIASLQLAAAVPATAADQTVALTTPVPSSEVNAQRAGATVNLEGGVSRNDATIVCDENTRLETQLNMPVYQWHKPGQQPRGIVLTVHGLAMHGKCYDYFGRSLANQGYMVVSTDMRGYGTYMTGKHRFCGKNEAECKEKTNYDRSFADLSNLSKAIKQVYPSVPLFAVGESLGGSMVIRLAAANPETIDGVILSAPALRHHTFIDPYVVADASLCMTNPRHQLDLTPFVRRYSSDDPRIVEEVLADPMARRHLSFYELLQASNAVHKTSGFVSHISPDMPVLVIQGGADKCVKAKGVMVLISELRSTDQTVKWFHERGHILIETSFIKPDTMDAINGWLDHHVNSPTLQAKYRHQQPITDSVAAAKEEPSQALFAKRAMFDMSVAAAEMTSDERE